MICEKLHLKMHVPPLGVRDGEQIMRIVFWVGM